MKISNISLESVLDRTNDWLRFAEAKNGALMAANIAVAFGVVNLLLELDNPHIFLTAYLIFVLLQLAISFLISVSTFFAKFSAPWWSKFPDRRKDPNILYFGDICSLDEETFLEVYREIANLNHDPTTVEKQLANQIVINAKITYLKMNQFNIAAWITLSAIATPLAAFYLYEANK